MTFSFSFSFQVLNASYEAGHQRVPGDETYLLELKEYDVWPLENDNFDHCTGHMYEEKLCGVTGTDKWENAWNNFYLKFHVNAAYTKGDDRHRCMTFGTQDALTSIHRGGLGTFRMFPESPYCRLDYTIWTDDRKYNTTGTLICESCDRWE
ncbi:unnamed protein product, partial [Mesorhabditis spiculigera]